MNSRGGLNPMLLVALLVLIISYYVWLKVYIPMYIGTMQTFIVQNVPYGVLIDFVMQALPLLLAIFLLAYAVQKSGLVRQETAY